jgi:rRNA-processing protein EBP2
LLQTDSDPGSDGDPGVEQFRLENIKDRPPIFEAEALHEVLEDFAWTVPKDWSQTQVISLETATDVPDVHDDMARELAFYNNGKAAAELAIEKLEGAEIPWLRPPDYYAETVKSDGHMAKVKAQLIFEQKAIEEAEQRSSPIQIVPLPFARSIALPCTT